MTSICPVQDRRKSAFQISEVRILRVIHQGKLLFLKLKAWRAGGGDENDLWQESVLSQFWLALHSVAVTLNILYKVFPESPHSQSLPLLTRNMIRTFTLCLLLGLSAVRAEEQEQGEERLG